MTYQETLTKLTGEIISAKDSKNYREMSILIDVRQSFEREQLKPAKRRRSLEKITEDIRDFYAGDNPYLACQVEVEVIG